MAIDFELPAFPQLAPAHERMAAIADVILKPNERARALGPRNFTASLSQN